MKFPIKLIVFLLLAAACKSQSDDTSQVASLALLQQSSSGSRDVSQMAVMNSENELGNPASGRAPDHAPLWPARGDFGFFAPEVINAVDGTFTTNIAGEVKSCPGGGSVTLSGTQHVTIATDSSSGARTVNVSGGERSITYDRCALNPMTTINSGALTVVQSGEAVLVISQTGTGERHAVSNLAFSLDGSMDIANKKMQGPPPGPAGGPADGQRSGGMPPPPPPSGLIELDLSVTIESRILEWDGAQSALSRPRLVERAGNVSGMVTVNGTAKDVSKTLTASEPLP